MDKNWISIHIFYASNSNPLLIDCVEPLVNRLRADKLIQSYFFIKYWMEGPHIRLRLLPTEGSDPAEVKTIAEKEINAYLQCRPALYEVYQGQIDKFYQKMFVAEYGEERWEEQYGETGYIPLRTNNSLHYIDYEPEYDRYGGVQGMDLSEWHFEHSSDIVLRLLRTTNIHVRTIMLGISIQLTLPLCYGLLGDDAKLIEFFGRYMQFWQDNFHEDSSDYFPSFEKRYQNIAPELRQRIQTVRQYMREEQDSRLTQFERDWIAHIRELRTKIESLMAENALYLPGSKGQEPAPITSPDAAFSILMSSYIHMTNNRLGVTILDEIYLSFLMKRALEEEQALVAGRV